MGFESVDSRHTREADIRGGVQYAEVAQLVEHNLAKVGVAGSSPVFRSSIRKILV